MDIKLKLYFKMLNHKCDRNKSQKILCQYFPTEFDNKAVHLPCIRQITNRSLILKSYKANFIIQRFYHFLRMLLISVFLIKLTWLCCQILVTGLTQRWNSWAVNQLINFIPIFWNDWIFWFADPKKQFDDLTSCSGILWRLIR